MVDKELTLRQVQDNIERSRRAMAYLDEMNSMNYLLIGLTISCLIASIVCALCQSFIQWAILLIIGLLLNPVVMGFYWREYNKKYGIKDENKH